MVRKKIILVFIVIAAFAISGCDVVKEENRLIEITVIPLKRVLLLDFTDQNCINCLAATAEISKLKEHYGDTLVAVSIHATPLRYPLRTTEGNKYEEHFNAIDHPTIVIDGGKSGEHISSIPQQWRGFILSQLSVTPLVDINLLVTDYDSVTGKLNVKSSVKGLENLSKTQLQLWIIENNIKNWQLIDNHGTIDPEYIHNHVFRSSINGTWGEEISVEQGIENEWTHSYTLKEEWKENGRWKIEDFSIIGFVYNPDTDEVFDATEVKLENKNE